MKCRVKCVHFMIIYYIFKSLLNKEIENIKLTQSLPERTTQE